MTGESRRHPRWQVRERLEGRISPEDEASVLDLSLGGLFIEHSNLLLPGTLCFLTLFVHGQEIRVACRVVRSTIHRFEVWPTGEQNRTYRTGLKFQGLSEDSQRALDDYIAVLGQEARAEIQS